MVRHSLRGRYPCASPHSVGVLLVEASLDTKRLRLNEVEEVAVADVNELVHSRAACT